MKCFYHPDRDSVSTCSRCEQAICSECNYVAGTNPICRSCWDELVSANSLAVRSKPKKKAKVKAKVQEEFVAAETIEDAVQTEVQEEFVAAETVENKVEPGIQEEFTAEEAFDEKDKAQDRMQSKQKAISARDANQKSAESPSSVDKVAGGIEFGLDKMGDGIIFSIEKVANVFTLIFKAAGRKPKR